VRLKFDSIGARFGGAIYIGMGLAKAAIMGLRDLRNHSAGSAGF
jgi:hypothetical protein